MGYWRTALHICVYTQRKNKCKQLNVVSHPNCRKDACSIHLHTSQSPNIHEYAWPGFSNRLFISIMKMFLFFWLFCIISVFLFLLFFTTRLYGLLLLLLLQFNSKYMHYIHYITVLKPLGAGTRRRGAFCCCSILLVRFSFVGFCLFFC